MLYQLSHVSHSLLWSLSTEKHYDDSNHNERDGVSNHRRVDCLLKRLFFQAQIKIKTSNLRVTGLREGTLPVTGEFPAQRPSYEDIVSIWWRHHGWLNSRRNVEYRVVHIFRKVSVVFSVLILWADDFLFTLVHWPGVICNITETVRNYYGNLFDYLSSPYHVNCIVIRMCEFFYICNTLTLLPSQRWLSTK